MAAAGIESSLEGQPLVKHGGASSYTGLSSEGRLPLRPSGNSAALTAGILVADVVGAGILSMAPAVSRLGYGLGSIAIVFFLLMNVHIALMLWRVQMKCPGSRTLVGLTSSVFAGSTEEARMGMVAFAGTAQYVFLIMLLCVYILTIGKSIGMLFYDVSSCLPMWTLLGSLIVLPMNTSARKLGTWHSLIWLNCSTICGTIVIPLVYMMVIGVSESRPASSEMVAVRQGVGFSDVLMASSTFAFAFTGQFINVEIISEMRDPTEFPKAYVGYSLPFQAVAFLIVGLGGYYYKGDSVTGMITDNIPFGPSLRASAACLTTHMVITYVIKAIVACRGIQYMVARPSLDSDSAYAWRIWVLIVMVVLSVSWTFAQVVPFFVDLTNVVGACMTPAGNWILPIILYIRCFSDSATKGHGISVAEWCVIALELSISIVLTVAGTYVAGDQILQNWHTYGGPFGCHCEDMWNTCECSATHAGMEELCLAPGAGAGLAR